MTKYYAGGYFSEPPSLRRLKQIGLRIQPKLDMLNRFVNCGRLLEVGPGMGSFAWLAMHRGFDVEVIEQDPAACRYLEETINVEVTQSAFPEQVLATTTKRYDVITLWHSIEHLAGAWETLTHAVRVLRDGGILVVATPNPSSWQFRILGAKWPHVDAPRHIWLIPLKVITRHVALAGGNLVWSTTNDPEGRQWNRFGWSQTLLNAIPAGLHHTLPAKALSRGAGSIIAWAVSPWERADFAGTTYTAIFRKGSHTAISNNPA